MAAPFSVEGLTPGTAVSGMDPNGNIWSTGTVFGVAVSATTVTAGTQGAVVVSGIQTYTSAGGVNSSAEAAGTILSTLSIANRAASGTQLPDLTRDYMCYVSSTGGGTNCTLLISPNSAGTTTVATVFAAATLAAGTAFSWRQPAGWYVMFTGTATLGVQNGVPC